MGIFFVAFSQNLNFSSISSAKLISSTSSTTGSLPNCQAFVQPFENTEKEGTRARRAATMVELGCVVSTRPSYYQVWLLLSAGHNKSWLVYFVQFIIQNR